MSSRKTKLLALLAFVVLIVASIIKSDEKEEIIPTTDDSKNTPVLEMDQSAIETENKIVEKPKEISPKVIAKPLISAEAYLVANIETGEIYAEHNKKAVFPIASISKLVTATISSRLLSEDKEIAITQSMLDAYGDAGHLSLGEIFYPRELLPPLLLESSNDAAEALAQGFGYAEFISNMNSFVRELGMNSTSFRDASGLSPYNVSNTEDLLILSKYLYNNRKDILSLSRTAEIEIASSSSRSTHVFHTINPFVGDPNFIGGKTGRTDEARESMISIFSYALGNRTYPIAIIVLRSDFSTREVDSSILFEQAIAKIGLQTRM